MAVDPIKINAITLWKTLKILKGVQAFLRFCNFYCKFVRGYSRIVKPLTSLIKKG